MEKTIKEECLHAHLSHCCKQREAQHCKSATLEEKIKSQKEENSSQAASSAALREMPLPTCCPSLACLPFPSQHTRETITPLNAKGHFPEIISKSQGCADVTQGASGEKHQENAEIPNFK